MDPATQHLLALYRSMFTIRRVEEESARAYAQGKIGGFLHLYIGQEAIAVGAAAALKKTDFMMGTYRDHGIALARGMEPKVLLAELFGKASGCSKGLGGSMHLFDADNRMLGGYGIVGGHIPLAAGVAFASKYRGDGAVTVCFFGDGAVPIGDFHEGMHLAQLWKLPVVFVCENNQYSMGTPLERTMPEKDVSKQALGYGMASDRFLVEDVRQVEERLTAAIRRAREESLPTLIECITYRYRGHSMSDPAKYRTKEEVDEHKAKDPLLKARKALEEAGAEADAKRVDEEVEALVQDAVKFADEAPEPDASILQETTYVGEFAHLAAETTMPELRFREALRAAMVEEMERDESVLLLGEEVGHYQGAYKVSEGMLEKFGEKRVLDTPIAESGFAGVAIGAAMNGLRPIVEFMTWNFSAVAFDQILNNAAKLRQMSGGQFKVPIVFRAPNGSAKQVGSQHSHAMEHFYAHVPGLKCIAPAFPEDAYGLMKSAIRDDNPVLVFESETLYGVKGPVPDDKEFTVPIGKAKVVREGKDVTIVAWSRMVHVALEAAGLLEKQGIAAEVIDLRSLRPLDHETVVASIGKTHRAVLAYEGWPYGGVGSEIAFRIQQHAFDELDAPVERVTFMDVPMPYNAKLEQLVIPNAARIVDAVKAATYTKEAR